MGNVLTGVQNMKFHQDSLFSRGCFLMFLTLSGCISTPVVTANVEPDGPIVQMPTGESICLLIPQDASYQGEFYHGSGDEIGSTIKDALNRLERSSRTVKEPVQDIQASCIEEHAPFVLQTKIARYEDRWTGWTDRPDRIEL